MGGNYISFSVDVCVFDTRTFPAEFGNFQSSEVSLVHCIEFLSSF